MFKAEFVPFQMIRNRGKNEEQHATKVPSWTPTGDVSVHGKCPDPEDIGYFVIIM